MAKTFNKNAQSDFIHSEFETTFYIPENFDQNEIENFVEENQSSINGTLKYFINDSEFIEIKIVNGYLRGKFQNLSMKDLLELTLLMTPLKR